MRKALEFCWIPGGWDADRDGVMEGCQHNTMDVEYFGPNPQMEGWYLGALRAAEEMARYLGETEFAVDCRRLFEQGRAWTDAHLFNGEYYEHQIRPPAKAAARSAPGLLVGMGAQRPERARFPTGAGLPGGPAGRAVYGARLRPGLPARPRPRARSACTASYATTSGSGFDDHFNCMRSYVLGDEAALLMASYPHERPARPFPYFTEVMTGFEYTAAVGHALRRAGRATGLECIADIRARYDGRKRSPFDEAECGHHYARAMASWAAVLALTGFHYSAVERRMTFAAQGRQLLLVDRLCLGYREPVARRRRLAGQPGGAGWNPGAGPAGIANRGRRRG